jgi:tRNA pseudouridine55 synthase
MTPELMDGLLNTFKPTGITSAKFLYRVRKVTGIRKSGHAGTLDPAADGVLLIGVGKGTKLTETLMDLPKVYTASARLDVTSSSFDSDRPLAPVTVGEIPTRDEIDAAAQAFVGAIEQVPPAVSALKVGGRPAYKQDPAKMAERLAPRPVQIYWLKVTRYDWPTLDFAVACGRGTYVRALIRDWGQALNAGGCLTSLRRTAVGPFTAENALGIQDLTLLPLAACVKPLDSVRQAVDSAKLPTPDAL